MLHNILRCSDHCLGQASWGINPYECIKPRYRLKDRLRIFVIGRGHTLDLCAKNLFEGGPQSLGVVKSF